MLKLFECRQDLLDLVFLRQTEVLEFYTVGKVLLDNLNYDPVGLHFGYLLHELDKEVEDVVGDWSSFIDNKRIVEIEQGIDYRFLLDIV